MKDIIIFCGPPADVQYTLDIYEKNIDRANISIFIISNKKNYKFIESLGLKLKNLILIEGSKGFTKKNPYKIIKEKYFLEKAFTKYFDSIKNHEIYFFNKYASWKTFFFLSRLSMSNKCIFWDYFDGSLKGKQLRSESISLFIKRKIIESVTNTKLEWSLLDDHILLEFPYESYSINKIKAEEPSGYLYGKYSYKLSEVSKYSVLLFESGNNFELNFSDYQRDMKNVLDVLTNTGKKVYVKPHPRLGHSPFLDNYPVEIIPDYVPGEFIDQNEFLCILGIDSIALAKIAKNKEFKVISLINLFEFEDERKRKYLIKFLTEQSDNKVMFIKSIDELLMI